MVLFFAVTMLKCNGVQKTSSKMCSKSGKNASGADKRFLRDGCLFCGIIIIILGSVLLFTYMEDDDMSENSYVRQRILLIACFLFIASTGLCLYVMRTDRNQEESELLELLVLEKPPTYDSVVFNEPPPAYITVVKSIHIIQQETTG